jgi:hypothetical protein
MANPHPPAVRLLSASTLACALAGVTASGAGQPPARAQARQTESTHHEMSMTIIRNQRITCGETAKLTFEACAAERACGNKRPSSAAIATLNDAIDREARARARAACGEGCGEIAVTKVQNSWKCETKDKLCATRTVRVTCRS